MSVCIVILTLMLTRQEALDINGLKLCIIGIRRLR